MLHDMRHTIYLCLLALTVLLCPACTDTLPAPVGPNDGQTATVCLHIPQLEAATRVVGTDWENAIYTLRVVILSTGAQSINRCFTSDKLKNTSTLSIDNVPVGLVQIYVIANEKSIGRDYTDLSALQADVEQTTEKLLITDPDRTCFPKRGSVFEKESQGNSPLGLPMGWMDKSLVINEGSNTIQVKLERQVAKLNIKMTNALSVPITVTSISFGAFHSDRFYFFRETDLDVPQDAVYAERVFHEVGSDDTGITIAGERTETMVCYVYPSFAWKSATEVSPYTIGFTTEKAAYTPQNFMGVDYEALNSITRNTQVNIAATLSHAPNLILNFSVEPWTEYESDVPSFD